jgi:hypothetical protein
VGVAQVLQRDARELCCPCVAVEQPGKAGVDVANRPRLEVLPLELAVELVQRGRGDVLEAGRPDLGQDVLTGVPGVARERARPD